MPVFLAGKSHGQRSMAGYTVHGVTRLRHNLATKPNQTSYIHGIMSLLRNTKQR